VRLLNILVAEHKYHDVPSDEKRTELGCATRWNLPSNEKSFNIVEAAAGAETSKSGACETETLRARHLKRPHYRMFCSACSRTLSNRNCPHTSTASSRSREPKGFVPDRRMSAAAN
jgi:hypothetical protein